MKRGIISILSLAVLVGAGIFVWRTVENRAEAAKLESEILKGLTEQEISEVLKSEATADYDSIKSLNEIPEKREIFLKGLRETLALAAQARRDGLADDENFKINLEYKKNILLSDLYQFKLSRGTDKLYIVPNEQMEKVWKNPANEKLFQRDMNVLREIRLSAEQSKGSDYPIPELKGNSLGKARNNWARTKILSEMARQDKEFIGQQAIPLRFKIIEAGILANDYLRTTLQEKINATDQEIALYVKDHPEYNVQNKLAKAEEVLAKVKAGGDFEKLAEQYSEDRMSSERGGIYENIKTEVVWKEVEDAALQLEPNEVADHLIESNLGFHIVKLVRKNNFRKDDRSDLEFTVRHIVLQKKFVEPGEEIPGIPRPFHSAEEIAKAEIEKVKREKLFGEIISKNPISLPKDFTVILPKTEKVSKTETQTNAENKN